MVRRDHLIRYLRFPLVFGGMLAAYFTAFSFRKVYFKDEIVEAREKYMEQIKVDEARIEAARQAKLERMLQT